MFLIALCSCQNNKSTTKITSIDITNDLQSFKTINLSEFASELEYVVLESTPESAIRPINQVYFDENYVCISAFKQISLFNKKDGQFVREIGHYGKDPSGYFHTLRNQIFEYNSSTIKVMGWNNYIFKYSFEGQILDKIPLPPYAINCNKIDEDNYIGYIPNLDGSQDSKLVIFDRKGSVIKKISNTNVFPKLVPTTLRTNESYFFKDSNSIYFKELFNDTIFQVSEHQILPKYAFNMDKYSPPYKNKFTTNWDEENFIFIDKLNKTVNKIFFKASFLNKDYYCLYDDAKNQVFVGNESIGDRVGFQNDIDNSIPFCLDYINDRNEAIGFIWPYEIATWIKLNPTKVENLTSELRFITNMDINSNPIMMIVKLKE